ncbi:MAG: DUF1552 domain-containing protein, partial [Blastocatellia bacterium]
KPPMRMAFVYVPNGIIMADWTPEKEGREFALPRTLEPLAAHRDQLMILSGLTLNGGRALGDGAGDHARAAASFLTGAHPKKTAGADITNGVSVDQFAAQQLGNVTRFATLELGCEDNKMVGNCDSGYSCAYSNSLAWKTPATPLPPETNPRAVFERLFGDVTETAAERAKRERYNKSILDFVREDTRKLKGSLGASDQRKLDEYLTAVREIEKRIETAERTNREVAPTIEKPSGVPADFADHLRLMFDLTITAFQTDQSRIVTFMMCREGSTRTYREIGIPDAHHPLTHHQNNPEMVAKVSRINRYHVEQLAWFLARIKESKDIDGSSLLDNTMILYGSGLSDGNRHRHEEIPCLVAGGRLPRLGHHIRYPKETPMTNLYLAILERMNVQAESFGDSNGRIDALA